MITVIKNAQIYTCNEKHPKADCIVLDDKKMKQKNSAVQIQKFMMHMVSFLCPE